jgi:3-hydroxymyristoyl/3-hydroxydecanoyl-(acyl carrier protein) dehydratase
MRFIFIDKILEVEKEKRAKGVKNLAMSEDYFEHHFPFFPVMPGVLMLQAMAELASHLILYSTEFKYSGLLVKVGNAKFRKPAQPGDTLDVQVEWMEKTKTGILFTGTIYLDGKAIAMADFENKLVEINSNEDRSLLKRDFEFVTRRLRDLIEEQDE